MGTGILVCGLNGAGKSTLGRALAKELDFHFIDSEELYFPKTENPPDYSRPRKKEEALRLLLQETEIHQNFVLAAVTGELSVPFQLAVKILAPKEIRMKRLRDRSFSQFGGRVLPQGDLYEQEEAFFRFAASRTEDTVEDWLNTLSCPVLTVDGTKSIAENCAFLAEEIRKKPLP